MNLDSGTLYCSCFLFTAASTKSVTVVQEGTVLGTCDINQSEPVTMETSTVSTQTDFPDENMNIPSCKCNKPVCNTNENVYENLFSLQDQGNEKTCDISENEVFVYNTQNRGNSENDILRCNVQSCDNSERDVRHVGSRKTSDNGVTVSDWQQREEQISKLERIRELLEGEMEPKQLLCQCLGIEKNLKVLDETLASMMTNTLPWSQLCSPGSYVNDGKTAKKNQTEST